MKLRHKKLSVWILLFAQVLLILSYFYLRTDTQVLEKVSFIKTHTDTTAENVHSSSQVLLKTISTSSRFIDFNSSLCYTNGSDLIGMKRLNFKWQCSCLPDWHGKDCGQPEVVWRAFLTHRKPIKLKGPRSFERRLIYVFSVDKFNEIITEIRLNELESVVDLFVLIHDDFRQKLSKFQHKILYLKKSDNALQAIENLRDDDVVLTTDRYEIPNKYAINFLKYYDNWPEPVQFRLRWSVFGFFWLHPGKTIISGKACSVSYLRSNLSNNVTLLGKVNKGVVFGDLNHFGGWFCEYCYDVNRILELLASERTLKLGEMRKIDAEFLEDAIENGLYIDGKTELVRTHRYQERYFAPYYVTANEWNYEYLLSNIYSRD